MMIPPRGERGDAVAAERSRPSLREEKKAETRRALVDTALRLFLSRGYEETTLEDICAEVRVSIRTALRYFETKEQLALAWHIRPLAKFRADIFERPDDLPVLDYWRAYVARYSKAAADSQEFALRELIYSVPALYSRWLSILTEYEDLLTIELAREAGTDPDEDLYARLAATCLLGGNEAVARRWVASGGQLDLAKGCLAVVDFVAAKFPPRRAPVAARGKPATP
jgi:AcrR family transcriptional regulator